MAAAVGSHRGTMAPPRNTLDALLQTARDEPDPARASDAAQRAIELAGLAALAHDLVLPEALTDDQRRVAEALLRGDLEYGGPLPASPRLLRRWLGVDPPSVLERRVDWVHEGAAVRWPLWKAWRDAPLEMLEHNQGVPAPFAEMLTPAELIEAAGERALEPYKIRGSPLEARLADTLDRHGASAAPWAAGFADLLTGLRDPVAPRARLDAVGYGMLGIYDWDTLGMIALVPLVRAGVPIESRRDLIVPFSPHALARDVLLALPPERREAVVFRRLMTDWGGGAGVTALNGFSTGLALLDLAPSERVTRVLMGKLRNNRGHFKKAKARIDARLEALAAEHPGVAAGMKPAPRAKKAAAGR
jgi:hypothetical protein